MSEEHDPLEDDRQSAAGDPGFSHRSTMNLVSCLFEKSKALQFAAYETREETEPFPRNLLAAFTRIERHVEIFLKVTNASLVRMHAPSGFLAAIALHRRECALKMVAIGDALACPGGFLPPEVHDFSEAQCRSCLLGAAALAEELGNSFHRLAQEYSAPKDD